MGRWVFEQLRGGPRRTPQEAELFKDKDADEGEYPGNDYLVREVLQNALDARPVGGTTPVRVRFAIHEPSEAPPQDRLAYHFGRLKAPLESFQIEFDSYDVPQLAPRYLVCEDFGTGGLEGDEHRFTDPAPDDKSRQDFYWFWRNIGRSAKTGDDLGRWGLGKTVYRAVSRVRCMFGLTVRRSDGRALLMGQGVLQPHSHRGREYHPEGYWCSEDNGELPQPIVRADELDHFRSEWRLTRKDEPGLSVVSPFVPEELRAERILQAVVVNFFVRVLRSELIVEVCGAELGTVTLDANTIDGVCLQLSWTGGKRKKLHAPPPLDFVRQCLRTQPAATTAVLGVQRAPEFNSDVLKAEELTTLQRRLANGQMVPVRVRIALPRRSGTNETGEIDVFLQRVQEGERCDSYYVREGMTITKRSSRAELHGIQAFVNVESGPMAKLLGDTEGPAHEDWDKSAERPDREWKTWKNRVEFARKIVDGLVDLLTPKQTEPDFDLLADFFSIEESSGEQREREHGEKNEGDSVFPEVVASPKWFYITERAGGFTVGRNGAIALPEEPALRVCVAYDLPRGNPLNHWDPIDFTISAKNGGLQPRGAGVKARSVSGNIVHLEIEKDDFTFSVEGFDRYRDLYVRVDDVSGQVTDGEANL